MSFRVLALAILALAAGAVSLDAQQIPLKRGCRPGLQTISFLCSTEVGAFACTGPGDCDACENTPIRTGSRKVCEQVSQPSFFCSPPQPCYSCGDLYTGGECMEVEVGVWQCLFGNDAGVPCAEVCDSCS